MKELKYVEKIRRDDSLLSLPQSLSHILGMVGEDDCSIDKICEVILHDPGLTTKILKMANSSFYNRSTKISSVHQAVMVLGLMQVKCLALSASVFREGFLEAQYGINLKELFGHFISVALGCKMLAERMGFKSTEEAFIAGLLHDVGLVFFIHHFPDDYRPVIDKHKNYPQLVDAEREILGIDHATVGGLLAEKWNLPETLRRSIAEHHDLPKKITELDISNVVQLSELINKPAIDNRARNLEQRVEAIGWLCREMKVDRTELDKISYSLLTETISTAEFMGIDIGDTIEILGRANHELFDSFLTIENLFRERQELSRRILEEERRMAIMEIKNVAIATLSHYINNATMAISGRTQLIKLLIDKGTIVDGEKRVEPLLQVIDRSIIKILAVLTELKDLTNLEEIEKYSSSEAINIDDRVKRRMEEMKDGIGLTVTTPSSKPI